MKLRNKKKTVKVEWTINVAEIARHMGRMIVALACILS